MNRRDFLALSVIGALELTLGGCEPRPKQGTLKSGIKYTFERRQIPLNIMGGQEYHAVFSDDVQISDGYIDGKLGIFCIRDNQKEAWIVSKELHQEYSKSTPNVAAHPKFIVDDSLRESMLQRLQEVYDQQGVALRVQEGGN